MEGTETEINYEKLLIGSLSGREYNITNITLRIYFLNVFIDSWEHFLLNVCSAWRLKRVTLNFKKGAVFLISSKCARRSLHSGTGGGIRVDNGVHGSSGNLMSGPSPLKRKKKAKKTKTIPESLITNSVQMINAPCFQIVPPRNVSVCIITLLYSYKWKGKMRGRCQPFKMFSRRYVYSNFHNHWMEFKTFNFKPSTKIHATAVLEGGGWLEMQCFLV